MRDLLAELKELHPHGMAGARVDLTEQRAIGALEASRWLLEHLLEAENTDRVIRSVRHQLNTGHLATVIGVSGVTRHDKRVRFYSTVDLVNALEQEKAQGRPHRDQPAAHGRGDPG